MWALLITIAVASAFLVWYWARHPRRAVALPILIAGYAGATWLVGPIAGTIWVFCIGSIATAVDLSRTVVRL